MTSSTFKIGDIAKQTGVSVGTLRYYETLNLLQPVKRGNNSYRYYSLDTVQEIQFIKKAQSLGFSLEEIKQILNSRRLNKAPCDLVQNLLKQKIEQLEIKIKQMVLFKAELEGYQRQWETSSAIEVDEHEICPLIASVNV